VKKRYATVIVAASLALGGATYAVATDGDDKRGGCHEVSADGTSSLQVSERAMRLLRENGWKATSDDGLVCE
jgi:hypothetical protein